MSVMDFCVSFLATLSVWLIPKLELDFLYHRIFKELFQKLNQFLNVISLYLLFSCGISMYNVILKYLSILFKTLHFDNYDNR